MFLVNMFVKEFCVYESMWVVEANFINKNTNGKVNNHNGETWNFSEILIKPFELLN